MVINCVDMREKLWMLGERRIPDTLSKKSSPNMMARRLRDIVMSKIKPEYGIQWNIDMVCKMLERNDGFRKHLALFMARHNHYPLMIYIDLILVDFIEDESIIFEGKWVIAEKKHYPRILLSSP